MLSGIGPADHLRTLGIPVVANLPVGNNFHDHTSVVMYFDILNQSRSYDWVEHTVQNIYDYYVNRDGPLTMFPNAATYQVTPVNNQTDWPDIMTEMTRSNNLWHNLSDIVSQYGTNIDQWEDYWRPYVGNDSSRVLWNITTIDYEIIFRTETGDDVHTVGATTSSRNSSFGLDQSG